MNDIVLFPITEKSEDELGQIVKDSKFERSVFCEKKSVPQNEFFNAGQMGIKPECLIVVYTFDYQDEGKLSIDNMIYDIYRRYDRPDERTELYCAVKAK